MPKTYGSHVKQQAKTYIVMLNMTADEISKILEPSATTIDRWAKEGGWYGLQKLRNGSTMKVGFNALKQINRLYEQAEEEDRPMDSKEVDQAVKHRKMMEELNKELAFLSNGIEIMGMFAEHLREHDEDLFQQTADVINDFTQDLYKKFGEE